MPKEAPSATTRALQHVPRRTNFRNAANGRIGKEHPRYRAEAFRIHAMKKTAMSDQSNSKRNWRRPAARRRPVVATQLPAELQNTVDQWAARQPDKPKRSEAIRRLIEAGLASSKQTSGRDQAAKACEWLPEKSILWSIRMLRPRSVLGGSAVSSKDRRNCARYAKTNSTRTHRDQVARWDDPWPARKSGPPT